MPKTDSFVMLKVENEWGAHEYYLPRRPGSPLQFTEGKLVRIQWPNGSVADVALRVKVRNFRSPDSNPSSPDNAQDKLPVFDVVVNGLSVEIPLTSVKVRRSDFAD